MAISSALGGYTPPGLVLIKSQTIGTGVSSVTINDCFSSNYDAYKVVVSNVTASATSTYTTYFHVQMTSAGTASTTQYTYGFAIIDIVANTVSASAGGPTSITPVFWVTNDYCGGSFEVHHPASNAYTLFTNLTRVNYYTGYMGAGGGAHQIASSYDGFKLGISSGTMTGGTIRVYGFRK